MEGPVKIVNMKFVLIFCFIAGTSGDIFLQDRYENCGSYREPVEIRITDRDEEDIRSHSNQYYSAERNCMVTIIGKKQHQISLELTNIDIDGHAYSTDHCKGLCCKDYLKIFNSYRIDNARLLPGINQAGLCGSELPRKTTFQTSNNFVTIQFRTDDLSEYKTGFILKFRQYPWRNPGIYPDGGFYGGWNDGSRIELQVDWNEQSQIPGDYQPAKNPDYENTGGKSCYECVGCVIDYFDANREGATTRAGCYVCSKSWSDEFASAQRLCYTEMQYFNLLSTLTDSSVGNGQVAEYRGCKKFMDKFGRFLNYCFCDSENNCNSGQNLKINTFLSLASIFIMMLLK
ncbi:hypothetical protein SNE40_018871 [Patella caerulea]|uniref:CUB domain-containing protein n=1 Tax=Patella caerulea TaxID=87958 RepID=A0AAN8P8P0_PATCE